MRKLVASHITERVCETDVKQPSEPNGRKAGRRWPIAPESTRGFFGRIDREIVLQEGRS